MKENETYRLFAVREYLDNTKDIFHSWNIVEHEAEILHVKTAPVIFKGVWFELEGITKFFEHFLNEGSALGGECEGFVMRIADRFNAEDFSTNVCKYVRANHVQTDEHWRKNWQSCKLEK